MTLLLCCVQSKPMCIYRGFKAESGDLFYNTGSEPCASNVVRLQVKGRLQKVDKIDLLVDPVLLGGGPVAELLGLNQRAISWLADSTASEPWQMLRPTWMAKSPLMVPGREAAGFVSPSMTRPVFTAFKPSQTMAQTGPLAM